MLAYDIYPSFKRGFIGQYPSELLEIYVSVFITISLAYHLLKVLLLPVQMVLRYSSP